MSFRITGLSAEPFRHLYGLSEQDLAAHGAIRRIADACPGYPDRIELRDARPGESLLLVNYQHQTANTPYRSSHAIFVLEGAEQTFDRTDEIPDVLARRLLSLRGFSEKGLLVHADVVDGKDLRQAIPTFFEKPDVSYIHVHNAKQGCYAARIDRA